MQVDFYPQHWVNRYGGLVLAGVLLYGVALVVFEGDRSLESLAGSATLATPIILLAVRSFRAGFAFLDDRMIVRGWIWSRTIARDSVIRVSDLSWIVWRSRNGRMRYTPAPMFWSSIGSAPWTAYNEAAFEKVRVWSSAR